jgi:hypothetical protein
MARTRLLGLLVAAFWSLANLAVGQPGPSTPPLTYELVINGERFLVEGNRKVKVQSQEKPGTSYEVAIRVSPTQRLRLNTVELEYDLPAQVVDDQGKPTRIVRIRHELGFTLTLTDPGQAMEAEDREKVLTALKDSLAELCTKRHGEALEVGEPREPKFQGAAARGCRIHFRDPTLSPDPKEDVGYTCFAYVLYGPKFTVSCLIEYRDKYKDDCVPVIKKVLDSIRALP